MTENKGISLYREALELIPGGTQLLSKRPDQFSLGVWPTYFQSACGAEIRDLDGNTYVDMSIGGIGANILGYADPDVNSAVQKALARGNSCSLNCPEEVHLAKLLIEIHPWAESVRYARTGGEAMTMAIRLARAATGKSIIAFCGYHGWHDWYLAANLAEEDSLTGHLLPGLQPIGVPQELKGTSYPFHYNKPAELNEIVAKNEGEIAAIVIEPQRGVLPDEGFLDEVMSIAKKSRAVLIADEISAGFRFASSGSHILNNFEPDIAVFSKAIGNGIPIAAIIGKKNVMSFAEKTFMSSTYWTERCGPVAAIATIEKHRALDVGKHVVSIGKKIQQIWKLESKNVGLDITIGGLSPICNFSFPEKQHLNLKALFIQLMLDRGILASNCFYAMYAHNDLHVERYQAACKESFSIIKSCIDNGTVSEVLRGEPSAKGFARLTK